MTPADRAAEAQTAAANPATSAWVSANAGSGKTRVLTNRVARLLLHGVEPRRILCLTYTKAAAAEMSGRLFETLGAWSTMDDDKLIAALSDLEKAAIDPSSLAGARRLFAGALEAPGGLQIETIHAFCQRLLKRFPAEAGLLPDFDILDDARQAVLAEEAIRAVLSAESGPVFEAVSRLLAEGTEWTAREIAADSLKKRTALLHFIEAADESGGPIGALSIALGLEIEEDEAHILATQCHDPLRDEEKLLAAAEAMLEEGGPTNTKHGSAIKAFLSATQRAELFKAYQDVFITTEDKPRKTIATAPVRKKATFIDAALDNEMARVFELHEKLRAAETRRRTLDALTIAEAVIARYEDIKRHARALDYDDLIARTEELIGGDANEWVRFKLDGGIDHILVDEAQDTSPAQWRIVEALGAEFFNELTNGPPRRTIFAVGDEKQSIYSFQGADPSKFVAMRERFGALAAAAEHPWLSVELDVSFRSARQVLQTVDETCRALEVRGALTVTDTPIAHVANKTHLAGVVELWPPFVAPEKPKPEGWRLPVDHLPVTAPETELAARIAERIKTWLAEGAWLTRDDRPIRPGDIMILVRDRDRLFYEIVRALKAEKLDVAGMDRIRLGEEIAFLDLEAVARFAVLPGDDLALAEVLKGPLFRWSDDDLTELAAHRQGSLWRALRASADERAADATAQLERFIASARLDRPYEFLRVVLSGGGRRAFLARLGEEAEEVIEEILSLALAYESDEAPSVQGFLGWLGAAMSGTVKRDMEQAGNKIRVMTVHGAKGLEAPVVILPQTHLKPNGARGLGWVRHSDSGVWLWPPPKADSDSASLAAREEEETRQAEESLRQLYVAMTRAEERLYICGLTTARDKPERSWHGLIRQAMERTGREAEVWPGTMGWRLGDVPAPRGGGRAIAGAAVLPPLPAWVSAPPPAEPKRLRRSPSALLPEEEARLKSASPAGGAAAARARGVALHRLLELLPQVPPGDREGFAARLIRKHLPQLDEAGAALFRGEVLALLKDPAFGSVFGPNARAEVPIAGRVRGPGGEEVTISGQIDRLCVEPQRILVVDFKTNRQPPATAAEVPRAYLAQMAAYRHLLRAVYPGREVRPALLWTAQARLMPLDDALLDVIPITDLVGESG